MENNNVDVKEKIFRNIMCIQINFGALNYIKMKIMLLKIVFTRLIAIR